MAKTATIKQTNPSTVLHTAGSAISVGDIVVMGSIVGVALVDIANTETGAVRINGIIEAPKEAGTAWTQGDLVYWDVAGTHFNKSSTGNTLAGVAALDAASAATTGRVLLNVAL